MWQVEVADAKITGLACNVRRMPQAVNLATMQRRIVAAKKPPSHPEKWIKR